MTRILNGMWQVSGGHGQINHNSAINQMLEYAENGFNTWDMADIYGPAESLYGDFRNELRKRKESNELGKIQGFTKFVPNPGPMSNSIVTHYIEESLKKMNVNCIDLLQFHWWDYQDASYLDALSHLSKLQNEEKIKYLGLPRGTCSSPLAVYAATTSASANTSACEPSVFVFLPGPHIIWKLPSSRLIFPVGSKPSGKFSAIGITEFLWCYYLKLDDSTIIKSN